MWPAKLIAFYLITVIINGGEYTFPSCSVCYLILFLAGLLFVSQAQIFTSAHFLPSSSLHYENL
jgi:hypothetical protein